ncbi:Non-catalytic module family EXPN protein [Schizophyllum amplum]|uniref:Non-catalytic module family EXPN protein n=1 Tax=Schizophyllum amplum TaxID=97359 RepID=A0A550BV91_9AGAR|nr:Non-catalytic module family EXPN protein [Auriculariopsis ampla]
MQFTLLSAVALALAGVSNAMPIHETNGTALVERDVITGGPYQSTLTYYTPNGGYGACGTIIQNTDFAIAMKQSLFDSYNTLHPGNPNLNPLCGTQVRITSLEDPNAQGVVAYIRDSCPGCQGDYGIDATPALCTAVTGQADCLQKGTFSVKWKFGPNPAPAY